MSRESFLHLVPAKKLDSARWRTIFQIMTVIGTILVLISLLLLLQGLGAGDGPPAGLVL